MGDILSHTTTAGIAPGEAEINAVAGIRLFIAFFRGFFDEQNAGTLCSMIRQRCLSISGGEAAGGVRLLWMPAAKVYQHSVLRLIPVDASEIAGVQ